MVIVVNPETILHLFGFCSLPAFFFLITHLLTKFVSGLSGLLSFPDHIFVL